MTCSSDALTIQSARCLPLCLDFRMVVSHSLASRHFTVNVCVILESEKGVTGFGEGVPRPYVTDETPESAVQALTDFLPTIEKKQISSPQKVISFLINLGKSPFGSSNPAALCALELATLDLASKHWNISIAELLGLTRKKETLIYSLVVPLLTNGNLHRFLEHARSFHFRHVKVKVDDCDPGKRIRTVQSILGSQVEIRVDANCSWSRVNAHDFFKELAKLGVVSVEQPLPSSDLEGAVELCRSGILPVTLDESVRCPSDVDYVASAGACDIINVRISKCGGLLGSLRVIEAAQKNGLGIQLGAHVGESCILSAAGAHLAAGIPSFRWLEGFFGTHLLKNDLCTADIKFGDGGQVVFPAGPGLGVQIERKRIEDAHALFLKKAHLKNFIPPLSPSHDRDRL
ncbi:MAG TPA: enolase C-terminal domain-like protein [Anaerolineae bacterium]|nr:enolase C-terminal domain-like protein [Anaerolineae bacterium]